MREELYDYVFKRALAEVDELINLAPEKDQPDLRFVRGELLVLRPGAPAPVFKRVELAPKGPDAVQEEKVSVNRELFSVLKQAWPSSGTVEFVIENKGAAGLDFTGEWVCENGRQVTVTRENNYWVGTHYTPDHLNDTFIRYNENGNTVDSTSGGWNLKDRIRPGKNYK